MSKQQLNDYFSQRSVQPSYSVIQNDSVHLFCATTGADTLPPLLLIHGAPGAWYGSRNILADTELQQHFQVIAVDRLGYGNSFFRGRRKAFSSIGLQATAIHEALRLNRSGQKGIVLGSSYGGPIAAKMAIEYPDAFYHLVMLAPAIDPDIEKFWWFNKYVHHGPLKWMLPRFMRRATDEKYSHVAELRKLQPQWKLLSIPVTIVQGTADKIVNPANLAFARVQLAGKPVEFISLPGVSHLIRFQRADLVKRILLEAACPIGTMVGSSHHG